MSPEQEQAEIKQVLCGKEISYLTSQDIVLPNRKKTSRDNENYKIKNVWVIPAGTRVYFNEVINNSLIPEYSYFEFSLRSQKFGLTKRLAKEAINWNSMQEDKRSEDSVTYVVEI
jgi:hypothetical protein